MDFKREIGDRILTGFQILVVVSTERDRVERALFDVAVSLSSKGADYKCVYWTEGRSGSAESNAYVLDVFQPDTENLLQQSAVQLQKADSGIVGFLDRLASDPLNTDSDAAYNTAAALPRNMIAVMHDLHRVWTDRPMVINKLRSMFFDRSLNNSNHKRTIVLTMPTLSIPKDLEPCVTVIDFPLPGEEEAGEVLKSVIVNTHGLEKKIDLTDELRDRLVRASLGRGLSDIENMFGLAVRRHKGFPPEAVETIDDQKAAMIKTSKTLEYIPRHRILDADQIGGFDRCLRYLKQCARRNSRYGRTLGLRPSKGLAVAGSPGSGKSLLGTIAARVMDMPLVRWNFGANFASLVGESEANVRQTLQQIDALRGAVLFIDEADKAIGNAHEAAGDSGVTQRVFGELLTWMQMNTSNTFVILTMNRVQAVPPELLRPGRLDKLFYVGLPGPKAREAILNIHFAKQRVDFGVAYSDSERAQIVTATRQFTGAELEAVVVDSQGLAVASRDIPESEGCVIPTYEEVCDVIQTRSKNLAAVCDKERFTAIERACKLAGEPVFDEELDDERQPVKKRGTREVSVN